MSTNMMTVNSLSGGKTSSYLAAHYPADLEIFALVCVDDHNAAGPLKWDRKLKQIVTDKLSKYCPQYGKFIATTEDPKTIKVILDLEQYLGREIVWVRGVSFETMMDHQRAVPNQFKRFCTTILKIKPIFEHLFLYHSLPVDMRVGYRYDELERAGSFTDSFQYAYKCEYQPKSDRWIHRWANITWRKGSFVLIDDKVIHPHIKLWASTTTLDFPIDSNCQNCFWKDEQQLRRNFDRNPSIMKWAGVQEAIRGRSFKRNKLFDIANLGIQQDFFDGTGTGCQAGFCMD